MSRTADGIDGQVGPVVGGTPLKVFEGEPLEWTHYTIVPLPCDSEAVPVHETSETTVAGVFVGGSSDDTVADLVPDQCDDPVYLLGVNTVTDPVQYRIYATALSNSKIAQRHGFVRLFGRAPNPLLTGKWPDNTTATLSIWPCAAAFNTMYHSDWYQKEILPLRKDSARYRLMTFRPAD